MRSLFLFCCLLYFRPVYSQISHIKEYYKNGNLKNRGKTFTFSTEKNKILCTTAAFITKKFGKWEYFYPSGSLKQVEFYSKKKDCNLNGTPDGKFQYYSEEGKLLKEEIYKNEQLWDGDILDIYKDSILYEKFIIRKGIFDTVFLTDNIPDKVNFVQNPDFELYKGLPITLYQDGQQQIEQNIPFWTSANKSTADYYNRFRKLINVPENISSGNTSKKSNYIGVILYHHPTLYYSEYITADLKKKLEKGKSYCFKLELCLSQNSGYYVDKLGVFFSGDKPLFKNTVEKQLASPQILFSKDLSDKNIWTLLCDSFTASGNEKFLTIGRFAALNDTRVTEIKPSQLSAGEYNQSAYYLISEVKLYENNLKNCGCAPTIKSPIINVVNRLNFDLIKENDSINFDITLPVILKNIQFEFDKSVLLPSSLKELEKLKRFLIYHSQLRILITGHTDNIGSNEYNNDLSLSRAKAVFNWLILNGIKPARLHFEAKGSSEPIVQNDSEENRFINRRVEFKLKEE